MDALWTDIELTAPYGSATHARVTGLTARNGWHFDLVGPAGVPIQRDCTAPASIEDASGISQSTAQADIEAHLCIAAEGGEE